MTSSEDPAATLDSIRMEIDKIDETLHRLMVERTALARDVWKAKDRSVAGLAALRPAREAQMLRAFAARHEGEMPLPVLWRIWRELIIANIRAQSPISVHAAADGSNGRSDEVWDLARAHYGFDTEMTRHAASSDAVAAAAAAGGIAVLSAADIAEWAPTLMTKTGMHVFEALPRIVGAPEAPRVYLAGDVEIETSGADTTVVLVPSGEADAIAAAKGRGHSFSYIAGQGDTTLLGIAGIEIPEAGAGTQDWDGLEATVLGAHPDALIGEEMETANGR